MREFVGLPLFRMGLPIFSSGTPTFCKMGVLNSCFWNPSESSDAVWVANCADPDQTPLLAFCDVLFSSTLFAQDCLVR